MVKLLCFAVLLTGILIIGLISTAEGANLNRGKPKPPSDACPCKHPHSFGPFKCQEIKVNVGLLAALAPLDLALLKIKVGDIIYINCECSYKEKLIGKEDNEVAVSPETKCDTKCHKNVCCKNDLLFLSVPVPPLLNILPAIKNIVVLCNGIRLDIGGGR